MSGTEPVPAPLELSALVRRWVEAPAVRAAETDRQVLKFSLESSGSPVSVQLIRRDCQGRSVAWASVHAGPLTQRDVQLDLQDLLPADQLTASAEDVLVLRFKALQEATTVSLSGLRLEARDAPAPARISGATGPEGLHWPQVSGAGEEAENTILVFGTFDVENYGDLLFPMIAERRLREAGLSVTPVSPTDVHTAFDDAPHPLSLAAVAQRNPPGKGVLIGGGNIVHMRPTSLPDYRVADLDRLAYPALWVGATTLAAAYDLPIAWNAPGVPKAEFWWPGSDVFRATAAAADYLSVRDEESSNALAISDSPVAIVPDTAVEISRLWPLTGLDQLARDCLESRGFASDEQYVAVHVKERSLQGPVEELARELDRLADETGRAIALVAIGPCHGDDVVARRLGQLMSTPSAVFDRPSSLREIAALIACADLLIGSSLHAYITSFSYGRPGLVIAPPHNPKFQAFARTVGRPEDVLSDWATALAAARERLRQEPARLDLLSGDISRQLDDHWTAVVTALSDAQAGRSRRLDFLRATTAINLRRAGWGAALSGLVSKE